MKLPAKVTLHISNDYVTFMFYLCWVVHSVVYTLLSSEYATIVDFAPLNKLMQYAVIFGLFSCFWVTKTLVKRRNLRIVFFLISIVLVSINNLNKTFLIMVLFVLIAKNIDLSRFIKYDLILKSSIFFFIVLSCLVGIIDNYSPVINDSHKMSFGFAHPNVYCFYLFVVLLEYLYVKFYTLKSREWIGIVLVFVLAYLTGAARTSCISFVLVFLMFFVSFLRPKLICNRFISCALIAGFATIAALSFITVDLYMKDSVSMYKLNEILTGRLYMASEFLKIYEINLFGNDVITLGARAAAKTNEAPMILDNAYIRCVLFYGLIFSILIFILYAKKIFYLSKKMDPRWICIAMFFIISGFAESYFINIFYNVTLLFLLSNDTFRIDDLLERRLGVRLKHIARL